MISGGFSFQGSYHNKNQDRFLSKKVAGGYIICVSDGLGSCSSSEFGSAAFCQVLEEQAEKYHCQIRDEKTFLQELHESWILQLESMKLNIANCYATALFCIINNKRLYAFRLGDGFIGLKVDGIIHVLFDMKEELFANETNCMYEKFELEQWQKFSINVSRVDGVIICSDGVSFCETDIEILTQFVAEFVNEYESKTKDKIDQEISVWLKSWKSNDDKTLAYLIEDGADIK